MKKLSKDKIAELYQLYDQLDTEQSEIEAAMGVYNEIMHQLNESLQEVAEEIEAYIDDRSEKWKESERGDAYQDWLYFFEEEKDEIDEPCFDHGSMDDVPLEVGV
jgi:peptidoglycan hydrolase CwlO-like protein